MAGLAIIFGGIRIAQQLKLSFVEESGNKTNQADDVLEETKQKVMDTDKDGLSDWDELKVYNTSPYLADSDSDKIDDALEIKNGTDPNCPKGKECGSKILKPSNSPAGQVQNDGGATTGTEATAPTGDSPTPPYPPLGQGGTDATLPENLSAGEVRELLKQGGIPDEQLKDASDEDLLKLYEEVRKQ